ncbi:MAG: tRNA lysidine(34) synthetase TilS [Sulfitobacter sp.]|nr:tRNA lysidine(34) synthetase TilS [Sulfitobacter sp.]
MTAPLAEGLASAFLPDLPERLGVAVSGGGDSMALLHLLHRFCREQGVSLHVVTMDHGLRTASAGEAAMVARVCAALNLPHHILSWQNRPVAGNLQWAARDARYSQIAAWARKGGLSEVALGHTSDDQAETVLMRLARRAGVDGLSAMHQRTFRAGVTWVRPLLSASREDLREYLRDEGIDWIEDPSNEDTSFERIRARKALTELAPLGIDRQVLAEVADQMQEARRALEWQTFKAAQEIVDIRGGAVTLDGNLLRLQPNEIRRRLLTAAIRWITGSPYGPRRGALSGIIAGLDAGQAGTAEGCHLRPVGQRIWVFREYEAVSDLTCDAQTRWDERWNLTPETPPTAEETHLRALGTDGLAQCPDWRDSGLPHAVLLSTPSVWHGDTLLAAPLAGLANNWHARLERGADSFFAGLLPH